MSTTITVAIHCDHRDTDGYCGSVFRRPAAVPLVQDEAVSYGWQLGPPDLCPRCATRAPATERGQVGT